MLPNFFHAGVQKAASGTLREIFKEHPEIYTPRGKEINFFGTENNYRKGLDWYSSTYYQDAPKTGIAADLSVGYSSGLAVNVPCRILRDVGKNVKFLFVLRDPIKRAFSQYSMVKNKGQIDRVDFSEAISRALEMEGRFDRSDVIRVQNGSFYADPTDLNIYRYCTYVYPGKYYSIISDFLEHFDKNNFLILFTEDLARSLGEETQKIFDFLGVSSMNIDQRKRSNESQTLRYPGLRRIFNALLRYEFLRHAVYSLLQKNTGKVLKGRLMSWNYTQNTEKGEVDGTTAKLLRSYYESEIVALSRLLERPDLCAWAGDS